VHSQKHTNQKHRYKGNAVSSGQIHRPDGYTTTNADIIVYQSHPLAIANGKFSGK